MRRVRSIDPKLRGESEGALQTAIEKEFLWPNRKVLPTGRPSITSQTLLSRAQLAALEADDPLLQAEKALADQPAVSALVKERKPPRGLGLLVDFVEGAVGKAANSTALAQAAAYGT